MNLGEFLLKASWFAAIASSALFLPALRGRKSPLAPWAFALHAALVLLAAATLAGHFLAHRFQYAIVAQYSSRALSPALSLAAMWAGQEGSLLLWTAITAILALFFLRQPGALVRPAMVFVSATQAALLLLVVLRDPFRLTPMAPSDGMGLNPLLEDPWMVAHPPALFVGYAALLIPASLAVAALVKQEYRDWNRVVWPWALFAVVTLGIGIALGGIWAYKVLGWGGYWGWDPVENASLVPWLAAVALLHGLMIQRTTGAVVRTNLLLALLGWVLVLAGTWLTRSGALQDFSVHSFADSGLTIPLTALLSATTFVSLALLGGRWKTFESTSSQWVSLSREAALWLGMITVLVLTALVAFGTAAPLLTALLGAPASVQSSFYSSVSVPLAIALLLLLSISPVLRWAGQSDLAWLRSLSPGILVGALAALVGYLAGVRGSNLVLVSLAAAALVVNAIVTLRLFRRGWFYGAGYLGHFGIAVMVLGMVLSAALGKTERVRLPQGHPVSSLGYTLTYQGEEEGARGRRMLRVLVEKPGFTLDARPKLFPSPQGEGVVREPALARHGELYLSAMDVTPGTPAAGEPVWIEKGHGFTAGDVTYLFRGFQMEAGSHLRVLADLEVQREGRIESVRPGVEAGPQGSTPVDAVVAGLGALRVVHIDADRQRVALSLPGIARPAVAVMDFSTKPLVNLVWIGALLAVLGTGIAGFRRAREVTPLRERRHAPAPQGSTPAQA